MQVETGPDGPDAGRRTDPSPRPRRLNTRLAALVLLVVSTAIALTIVEAGLRIAGVQYDASLYGYSRATGWTLRPKANGWWISEGHAYARINGAGMHDDREFSVSKPAGTVRVAVLGDSMTAAVQVDAKDTFSRVAERQLAGCGAFRGRKVEVLNFGVPGFGTAQELIDYRTRVAQFNPDFVVVAFYTDNDIANNHRALNPVDAAKSPYFLLQDGQLVLDDSFTARSSRYAVLRDLLGNLANRSRLVQLLAQALLRGRWFRSEKVAERAAIVGRFGASPELFIYSPPVQPETIEAWRVTEAILREFYKEVTAHGSRFLLVTLSQPPQHLPRAEREAAVKQLNIQDLYYPDRRIEAFAKAQGIPALILVDRLRDYTDRTGEYVSYGNGHYNPIGHREVGTALAEELCRQAQ
jgi:hypothetical protein